jgi:DNA-binding CsgD family transcriptional regulator
LTPAEQRVLEEVRTGATNAEIAVRLGLSVNTVKYHVANMLAKTGLTDRAQLARWEMPREPGRWASWRMRAAVAVGMVAVVAAALMVFGLFLKSDSAPGAWTAFAPRGTGSGDGGLVVLELTSGSRHDLHVEEGWSLHHPVWSPTGEHLLAQEVNRLQGTSRLVVFERDGWNRSYLDGDFAQTVWAPDGSVAVAVGPAQVTVLGANGSVVRNYTDTATRFSLSPQIWSPNSRSYVVLRGPSDVLIGTASGEFWRIDDEFDAVGVGAGDTLNVLGWTADGSALILVASAPPVSRILPLTIDPVARTLASMTDQEYRAALTNRDSRVATPVGQDPRWIAAMAQFSADPSSAPPRLLGETADGRGLVFATGNLNQPDQLIITYGDRHLRVAGVPISFDESTLSVVLTGDWPSPATASITPP